MGANTNDIIMYSRERFWPDVARSRARLAELALDWTEHNIDSAAAAGVERLTGRRSVPALVIGSSILVEPSNAQLDAALAGAGFESDH